jgi:6-pyruvoyltetrahydropterin/6-carboxytetrahydropterin synthase
MFWIHKGFSISAAHKLSLPYESKCVAIHGHNWKITIHCFGKTLRNGMVIDFAHLKKHFTELFDHKLLNDILEQPTAENMAYFILNETNEKLLPEDAHCYKVEVEEADGSVAEYQL